MLLVGRGPQTCPYPTKRRKRKPKFCYPDPVVLVKGMEWIKQYICNLWSCTKMVYVRVWWVRVPKWIYQQWLQRNISSQSYLMRTRCGIIRTSIIQAGFNCSEDPPYWGPPLKPKKSPLLIFPKNSLHSFFLEKKNFLPPLF